MTAKATQPLQRLADFGQSVWIDYLSRELLASGELARLVREDAVVGVTSNPTIFDHALAQGVAYDEQIRDLFLAGVTDPKEIFLELATADVADAADLLLPIWKRTLGRDGYVSIEVDPTLAADRHATVAEATRLHEWLDRPNVYVKIPATDAGIGAIEEMTVAGRSINVTLIFSLERHQQVMEAYVHGLERLVERGGDPSQVHSIASFFVSRVDTETDARLETRGTPAALHPAWQARSRERKARLSELRSDICRLALAAAGRSGRDTPTLPVGVDVDEEPGLLRRALCRESRRIRYREYDA